MSNKLGALKSIKYYTININTCKEEKLCTKTGGV